MTEDFQRTLSIIVPVFNEEGNIAPLSEKLTTVLDKVGLAYEIIAVNDGSTDGSLKALEAEASSRKKFRIVDLRRNSGQTAAMMAGIDHASGDILIPIDADLQNDPEDIPLLLAKLAEGYDVVSGWRRDRKDAAIRRNFVSRVANSIISWISGVNLHDYGCTLKAYRRDVLKGVRLYGEMHRFIPIYATWSGARVTEIPVRHHPRIHGVSKYGLSRIFKVSLDILVIKFLDRHFTKPIYIFGGFGFMCISVSVLSAAYMIYLKIWEGTAMIQTPLPVVSAMMMVTGIMSILMGLLAEMMVRTYFESQQKLTYIVRQTTNFD